MISIYSHKDNDGNKLQVNLSKLHIEEYINDYFKLNDIKNTTFELTIKRNSLVLDINLCASKTESYIDKLKSRLTIFLRKIIEKENYIITVKK